MTEEEIAAIWGVVVTAASVATMVLTTPKKTSKWYWAYFLLEKVALVNKKTKEDPNA